MKGLALVVLLICTAWVARHPDWEPAAAFVGALIAFITTELRLRPPDTTHDPALLSALLTALPSDGSIMRFLRDEDLGNSFRSEPLHQLARFVDDWNNAEHEFLNKKLERKRKKLLAAAQTFINRISLHTDADGRDYLSIGVRDFETRPEMFKLTQELNKMATDVHRAHQELVRLARRLLKAPTN